MRLWYGEAELEAALKPSGILHLMFACGLDRVLYLDPATLLLAPLRPVLAALGSHGLALVPSRLAPAATAADDLATLRAGAHDAALVGARRERETVEFLRWWAARCERHCRDDPAAGMALDRRWLDAAPSLVDRVRVVRHPGLNVTPATAPERALDRDAAGVLRAGGETLISCRFPDPSADPGPLAPLRDRLAAAQRAQGWDATAAPPYALGQFADGRPITRPMRRWLLRAIDEGRLPHSAPLPQAGGFFDEVEETLLPTGVLLTRVLHQLWLDDERLRRACDIHTIAGLAAFYDWATGDAGREAGLDTATVAAARGLATVAYQARTNLGVAAPPPWPALASRCWTDRSSEVESALAGDVEVLREGETVLLPMQAALAWELRPDLPPSFPLLTLASLRSFLGWAMTCGIAEGAVDPTALSPGFLAWWNGPAHDVPADDVPVTNGMLVAHRLGDPKLRLEGWQQFPGTHLGRLAVGLAYALIARHRFGWPEAMVAPVARHFHEAGPIVAEGYRFSRAAMAVWQLRPDLQRQFPLATESGRAGLLRWLVLVGARELGIDLETLDPALARWARAESAEQPGLPNILALLLRERADLRRSFDPATATGRAGLREWAQRSLARDYGTGDVLASPAATASSPGKPRRAALGLLGQWSAPTGLGEVLRGFVAALRETGFSDFVVIDRDAGGLRAPDGTVLPEGPLAVEVLVVVQNADQAYATWRFARGLGVSASRQYGLWHWELERLPAHVRHGYGFYDAILATSAFQRAAFAADGLRPVRAVPMPMLGEAAGPSASRTVLGVAGSGPLFVLAFDFGSFIRRKNPEALIAAFQRAYPDRQEPATLLLKTVRAALRPHEMARLQALAAGDPRIVLRDEELDRDGILGLLAAADAFVSLHRSEGFGRGIAEAMLLGTPVIATAWSGPADFLDAATGWPVRHRLVPIRAEDYPGSAGQRWAEPDIDHAASLLREVARNPEEARARAARAQALIRRRNGAQQAARGLLGAVGLLPLLDWQAPPEWQAPVEWAA